MQFAELKVYFYFLKSIKKMNTLVLGTSYRHYEFSDHSSLNRDSKPKALMQLCLSSVRVDRCQLVPVVQFLGPGWSLEKAGEISGEVSE